MSSSTRNYTVAIFPIDDQIDQIKLVMSSSTRSYTVAFFPRDDQIDQIKLAIRNSTRRYTVATFPRDNHVCGRPIKQGRRLESTSKGLVDARVMNSS